MKWYVPDFDLKELLMLLVFIAVISCIIIAGATSSKRDSKCKSLGGVPIDGVCYEPTKIIKIN